MFRSGPVSAVIHQSTLVVSHVREWTVPFRSNRHRLYSHKTPRLPGLCSRVKRRIPQPNGHRTEQSARPSVLHYMRRLQLCYLIIPKLHRLRVLREIRRPGAGLLLVHRRTWRGTTHRMHETRRRLRTGCLFSPWAIVKDGLAVMSIPLTLLVHLTAATAGV